MHRADIQLEILRHEGISQGLAVSVIQGVSNEVERAFVDLLKETQDKHIALVTILDEVVVRVLV